MAYMIIKSAGDEFSFTTTFVPGTVGHSYAYAGRLAKEMTEAMKAMKMTPIPHPVKGAQDPIEALQFIVDQVTNKENAHHTLGAYSLGVGIDMAKKAIAAPIPHPVEGMPAPITIGADNAGEAINIAIIAIQMGIPVSIMPEPNFTYFTHLVYVYAKPDQLLQFKSSLEKIK